MSRARWPDGLERRPWDDPAAEDIDVSQARRPEKDILINLCKDVCSISIINYF
jgi:hypothetical protein